MVIEPTREDVRQMGLDLMSPIGRGTALVARRTTAEQLRRANPAAAFARLRIPAERR